MPTENVSHVLDGPNTEEAQGLLSVSASDQDAEGLVHHEPIPPQIPHHSRRQSSISRPAVKGSPRAPRTNNRVRFDIEERRSNDHTATNERQSADSEGSSWMEEEDFMSHSTNGVRSGTGQRVPLLTFSPNRIVASADAVNFDLEDLLESARPKSGLGSAFFNMANSIIGAGIIGQPYAFRQAGLTMGIILLVALTIIVDWTIGLIVINCKMSGASSFQATVEHCFGRLGLIVISIAQWAFAFGGMIAFCIIVGDTIPHVIAAIFPSLPTTPFLWLLTDRRAVIIIFIAGVSYPLCLYRDIAKLAKASTLALISMLVIISTVIIQGSRVPTDQKGGLKGSLFIREGVFQAIGVISFAFVCHHNSLLIYGSLKTPTIDRFARVTHYSTAVSMIACLVMALVGFLTFGDKTLGNVLNNFPADNTMVNVARLCFGLNMLTTLPLEAFVCREVITNYWFPDQPWNSNRHLIFSTSLVAGAVTLSLLTCDLGAVFELIGATSACILAYILPPLCYIKLSSRSWKTVVAVLCAAFGFTVLGISLVLTLVEIAKKEGDIQTC